MKKKKIIIYILIAIVLIALFLFLGVTYVKYNNQKENTKKTESKENYKTIYSYLISDDDLHYTLVLSNSNTKIEKNVKSIILNMNIDDCNSQYDDSLGKTFVVGPNWTNDFKNYDITKVIIKNKLMPLNTTFWFKDFKNLTEIEGLKNIDLKNVKDMSGMFSGCTKLTSLDLSSFDMKNVEFTNGMFANCVNLKTIYVNSKKWNLSNLSNSEYMFYNATNLVGENNTKFDLNHIDKEYARIDSNKKPGYLSSK